MYPPSRGVGHEWLGAGELRRQFGGNLCRHDCGGCRLQIFDPGVGTEVKSTVPLAIVTFAVIAPSRGRALRGDVLVDQSEQP